MVGKSHTLYRLSYPGRVFDGGEALFDPNFGHDGVVRGSGKNSIAFMRTAQRPFILTGIMFP